MRNLLQPLNTASGSSSFSSVSASSGVGVSGADSGRDSGTEVAWYLGALDDNGCIKAISCPMHSGIVAENPALVR